jgi:hypothetical protein
MSNLTDRGERVSDAELDTLARQNQTVGSSFGAGLRAGAYGGLSQVNTLAGTAMDAVTPGMGAGRSAAAKEYSRTAGAEGQYLTPLEDVRDVGSGLRYVAGGLGQMAPQAAVALGAGLLTRGALPRLGAATASQAPFEAGEGSQAAVRRRGLDLRYGQDRL